MDKNAKTVGDRIREAREAAKISQTDLAEAIGTTKQNLYKYENNIITNIPSDKIELIAKICGVSPAYLMGWDYTAKEAAQEHPLVDAIMAEVETLDEAEQEHLLHHIRSEKSFKQKTAQDGAASDK